MAYKLVRSTLAVGLAVSLGASLSGCATQESKVVTIATHDSFVISKAQIANFKKQTGLTVKVVKAGDAGALTNKLVLTQGAPIADAYFGIDNSLQGLADSAKVAATSELIDYGDVCLNYDTYWFRDHNLAAPSSFEKIADPRYRGLTVLTDPTTSSPGLAFLATTVAKFGANGWQAFWTKLKNNNVKIAAGWEDAYFTDFSGSSGKGLYPIVLSYSTSPAYEIRKDGKPQTASISSECFRQAEYAGVLTNAQNPQGAAKLVQFLKSPDFQNGIAESMYVYPALKGTQLPADWAKWGKPADSVVDNPITSEQVRKSLLASWTELFG
ncbi:MAG: thiamine ABC transporter substrate binding subunit [Micrococcales bacterium]